jgi:hypothetical protein
MGKMVIIPRLPRSFGALPNAGAGRFRQIWSASSKTACRAKGYRSKALDLFPQLR